MKLTVEEKKQRVAVLLCDLDELYKDIAWLNDMVDGTVGIAQQHYKTERMKAEKKLDAIKSELTRLRSIH